MPREKETINATPAVETVYACGTHAGTKIIVHTVVGVIALFLLCTFFAAGALIGKFAGNHGDGRFGRGGCVYQERSQGCGGIGNRGPEMMNGQGYGRGMMRDRQGNICPEDLTVPIPDDPTVPETQEIPVPVPPQGGATQ